MGWLPRNFSGSRFKPGRLRQGLLQAGLPGATAWYRTEPSLKHYEVEAEGHGGAVRESSLKACQMSVILPVYNEQACIDSTFDAVLEYAHDHPAYTFLFVNDGSADHTAHILAHRIAAAQTRQIHLVSYHDRGGKGHAIKRGIEAADGDFVCFIDGDLAYTLDHLDRLAEKLGQADIVIGCRNMVPGGTRGPRLTRQIAGAAYNSLSRHILNLTFSDMQAGLKGFRLPVAQDLFGRQRLSGFSFDVELIYLAKRRGYAIAEIPAQVSLSHARKVSKVNLLMDSLKMLMDLFTIRFNDLAGRYE